LKEKLASPKAKKRDRKELEKQIENILSGRLIKDAIKVEVKRAPKCKSGYTIEYRIDEGQKQRRIIDDIFGKKVFFTNRNS